MEKKNIQGMVYEVILLGESHNTGMKNTMETTTPSHWTHVCVRYVLRIGPMTRWCVIQIYL